LARLGSAKFAVEFLDGNVHTLEFTAYDTDANDYGNKMQLEVRDLDLEDKPTYESTYVYDIRYDTRIKRDLKNFAEYCREFLMERWSSVKSMKLTI
jgi:hypothetical protein